MQSFLIIDDESNIRMLLNNVLKRTFICRISEAENGKKGIEALQNDIPDLIFLDVSMPVMDGHQTLAAIRANPLYKKIAVIVLTAHSDKGIVGLLAPLGISDYIVKPIDIHDLVKRVKKVLSANSGDLKTRIVGSVPEVLLVESDKKHRDLLKDSFNGKFIVHEASSGTEAYNLYTKHLPKFVLVSSRIGLLDKKIIMQKIKESSDDKEVSIFLIVDDLKNMSHKVFAFDGFLKWNNNPTDFFTEFEKLVSNNDDSTNQVECDNSDTQNN